MIRALLLKRLDAAERQLGESVDYLRHMVRVSPRAFFRFARIMPMSTYRRRLPPAPHHVARMVATRDEDCGTCLQIEVNLARRAGLPVDIVRSVVDRRPEALPPELADVYRFSEGVVRASGEEDEVRERVRDRWGDEGLIELALAIASSRVFPVTKRALGYAVSCARVTIKL